MSRDNFFFKIDELHNYLLTCRDADVPTFSKNSRRQLSRNDEAVIGNKW